MADVFDPPLNWRAYSAFARAVTRERRYVWTPEVRQFLEIVKTTAESRAKQLQKGAIVYRAQKGVDEQEDEANGRIYISGYGAARMLPRNDRATEGRANPLGIPVLYVATQPITAISEVRPWIGAQVSLATLRVTRPLKIVDLGEGDGQQVIKLAYLFTEPSDAEALKATWAFIDEAFSRPVSREDADVALYAPTQILAELFREAGFDGVSYRSQFGDAGKNIALFDVSTVRVVSCAPFEVQAVKIEAAQIDNAWYRK
ncbi:RES family NAD+ phosphorylase [Rhizobium croatiense]|uniref:RES family NAD+ phosphorylase n=1 Tax=Rhizobium croatiense TaxID=2867516 RepID=UPI0023EDBE5D|nr:RES family NAD+ phosphorylase [Rhizobium croatiense]WET74117.1 RES family NAD+ phosphorylase [Rhizobium croatiense]